MLARVPTVNYQAKIFGGSNVHGTPTDKPEELIGMRNIQFAMIDMMKRGIQIQTAHVGETGNRRIIMDISTGDVWVWHILADGSRFKSMDGRN